MQQQPADVDSGQPRPPLLQLPPECLTAVLQQLGAGGDGDSAPHRNATGSGTRGVCAAARAHSRLHAAVAPALCSIKVRVDPDQPQLDSLMLYLERHSEHVSSLEVGTRLGSEPSVNLLGAGGIMRLRSLPACSQLCSLSVTDMSVQLGASSSHQGVLQAVPQLTRLSLLDECSLLDTDGGALTAALVSTTALRHLDVGLYWDIGPVKVDVSPLSQLQLTHLRLPTRLLDDAALSLQQLGSWARQLRELELDLEGDVVPAGAFSGLQQLTKLRVSDGGTEAGALAGINPKLQRLELSSITIDGGEEEAFLERLGQLQQLTHLELTCSLPIDLETAEAFSALTASSRLQRLKVDEVDSEEPLQADVWQHTFPAGRQRPALQELELSGCAMHVRDVEAMASACPGLQRLELVSILDSQAEEPQQMSQLLAPLSRLPQLSSLAASQVDDAAAGALLALSRLRSLTLYRPAAGLTMSGRLALTQLRALTCLDVYCTPAWHSITSQAPASAPPDVWGQLLEHCKQCDDPAVRLAAQQSAAAEARLDAQDRRIEELQQQVAGQQQQIAAQQAAQQAQQVAASQQQQQLAAVARQLAEQAAIQAQNAGALAQLLQG